MKFICITIVLLSFFIVAPSYSANHKYIELYVGQVDSLQVGEVKRLAIGVDEILGATVLDNGELLLIPRAPGETHVHLWKPGERKVEITVNILSENTSKQLRELRSIFRSFTKVKFRSVKDKIIAEGEVYVTEQELFANQLAKFSSVISFVKPVNIEMKDMVKVDVTVLEINKTDNMQFGINWDNAINGPSIALVNNFSPNDYFVYASEDNPFLELFDSGVLDKGSTTSHTYAGIMTGMNSIINILKEDGMARILAEPSLSTRSGEVASFHSGGQFPIAVLNEFGQPVVQMQNYGIRLDINPVTDGYGNIVSNISAEMSSIDFSTVVNGVPGLLTRNTESVINMKDGQTIIISGLLRAEDSRAIERIPFLGDIPIIGELFTSRNFKEGKSELVILVTPSVATVVDELPEDISLHIDELRQVGTPVNELILE